MLDARLRPLKDRTLGPVVRMLAPRVAPWLLSAASLGAGLAAAGMAAAGATAWSLVLWWTSRVADGLDGPVARARGTASDLGGFIDLVGDAVVYVAVPIGIASAVDERATWIAAVVMLATFYLNAVAWLYISAAVARRGAAASARTSIVMPSALIEGTETIVLYTVMLAFPARAALWFWIMAVLVAATVAQRAVSVRTALR